MRTRAKVYAFLALYLAAFAVAAAPSQFEADVFYNSAQGYIRDGDYENALMSIYRSREIYVSLNNTLAIKRCDTSIEQIGSLLSPPQLAEKYYNIAGTYFTQGTDDAEVLQRSILMATKAKEIYETSGGSTSSQLKTEDLIESARKRVSELVNQCVRDGDGLYEKAQNAFFANYFIEARDFALNASEKYTGCRYTRGIEAAGTLMGSINARMNDIRVQAKAGYDSALQYYTKNTPDDNLKCILLANSSQVLYKQINDQEGYQASQTLISRCRGGINEFEEQRKKEARDYMDEARRLYILMDCVNSTENANKAKGIYNTFLKAAAEEEAYKPSTERVKSAYFGSLINDVNSLLSRITKSCQADQMLRTAEEFYKKSQEYYLSNNLNEALAYVNNAKIIFTNFNNYVGISKCNTIIEAINTRINNHNEASVYMANAEMYLAFAEFDRAQLEASNAKAIYVQVYDRENEEKAVKFLATVDEGRANLSKANKLYGSAQKFFDAKDCTSAIPESENALALFKAINYTLGIERSANIIATCQKRQQQEWDDLVKNSTIVGVLVILSAALIYQFTVRRKALDRDYVQRKNIAEEGIRRKEEEMTIRTEETTKSMVDDELRKLIDAEREKLDGN
ncbi:MAG: hypothetical protein V1875_05400 [Candidatus Altiarchaeota archaeon]